MSGFGWSRPRRSSSRQPRRTPRGGARDGADPAYRGAPEAVRRRCTGRAGHAQVAAQPVSRFAAPRRCRRAERGVPPCLARHLSRPLLRPEAPGRGARTRTAFSAAIAVARYYYESHTWLVALEYYAKAVDIFQPSRSGTRADLDGALVHAAELYAYQRSDPVGPDPISNASRAERFRRRKRPCTSSSAPGCCGQFSRAIPWV